MVFIPPDDPPSPTMVPVVLNTPPTAHYPTPLKAIQAPVEVSPLPPTPSPDKPTQIAPLHIPSIPPRTKRPETLAHKMAWGWVDTIIEFLKVHRDRATESPAAVKQAFKSMLSTLAEVDEQKNLVSYDVISVSLLTFN